MIKRNFFTSIYTSLAVGCLTMFAACSDSASEVESDMNNINDIEAAHKDASNAAKAKVYYAEIGTLNGSGVTGMAELTLEGNSLTVRLHAEGLEPDMLHPQHVHGFENDSRNSVCPPPSADENGDGLVDLGEGLPFYGNVLLSLTPFPTAPDGTIDYEETFTVSPSIMPLQNRVIVLHGMTVDGEYVATLPVACGQISANNNGLKKGQKN